MQDLYKKRMCFIYFYLLKVNAQISPSTRVVFLVVVIPVSDKFCSSFLLHCQVCQQSWNSLKLNANNARTKNLLYQGTKAIQCFVDNKQYFVLNCKPDRSLIIQGGKDRKQKCRTVTLCFAVHFKTKGILMGLKPGEEQQKDCFHHWSSN